MDIFTLTLDINSPSELDWADLDNKVKNLTFAKIQDGEKVSEFLPRFFDEDLARVKGDRRPPYLNNPTGVYTPFYTDSDLQELLQADLVRLRTFITTPSDYVMEFENYKTFGYGYEYLEGNSGVLIRATMCADYIGAGGETEKELTETPYQTFNRLGSLGLIPILEMEPLEHTL